MRNKSSKGVMSELSAGNNSKQKSGVSFENVNLKNKRKSVYTHGSDKMSKSVLKKASSFYTDTVSEKITFEVQTSISIKRIPNVTNESNCL